MKLPNKYIAIDLETTDSDYKNGDIIQIGAIILNEDLTIGEEFETLIKPLTNFRNKEAMKVNKITEEDLLNAKESNIALQEFESFCLKTGEKPLLASWGTYFDIVFLREHYKKLNREYPFSYRCFDLKTVAIWEMAKRSESFNGGLNKFLNALNLKFEGKKHNTLDDIRNTIKVIQSFK